MKPKLQLCNHILKGYSILLSFLFTLIHPHTSDIITHLPCTTQFAVRLLTYPVLYSFKKRLKFPLTIQLLSLLLFARYSSFALFLYFHSVSGSLYISHMARCMASPLYNIALGVVQNMYKNCNYIHRITTPCYSLYACQYMH